LKSKKSIKQLEKEQIEAEEIKEVEKKKEKRRILGKIHKKKSKVKDMPVLYLRKTGKAEEMFVKPVHGMLNIDGNTYHEHDGSDWTFIGGGKRQKGKIICEWGLYPLGTDSYLSELKADAQEFQGDVIRAIQTAETIRSMEEKNKGKINPKLAVLGIIAIIVIGYFVLGG
jgi:hypothetical protein